MNKQKIAITTGDPNGIGAEVTIKALNRLNLPLKNVVLISNSDILNFYGKLKKNYQIIEMDFDKKNILPGKITPQSGDFAFRSLKKACEMVNNKEIDAIVTAPVSKESMNLAGHKFSGQTEILQKLLAKKNQFAEMLFLAKDFRVLLFTRHVPLKDVLLTKAAVIKKIENLDIFFKSALKIKNPSFALCGFNPHAGEGGILGEEEANILSPAVKILKRQGIQITEPIPADTLFVKAVQAYLKGKKPFYDCYIANYHDQGLIPIKAAAFNKTVNMTIGLDVIRTSPSHGTAFDIAGKNLADESSMIEAIKQSLF